MVRAAAHYRGDRPPPAWAAPAPPTAEAAARCSPTRRNAHRCASPLRACQSRGSSRGPPSRLRTAGTHGRLLPARPHPAPAPAHAATPTSWIRLCILAPDKGPPTKDDGVVDARSRAGRRHHHHSLSAGRSRRCAARRAARLGAHRLDDAPRPPAVQMRGEAARAHVLGRVPSKRPAIFAPASEPVRAGSCRSHDALLGEMSVRKEVASGRARAAARRASVLPSSSGGMIGLMPAVGSGGRGVRARGADSRLARMSRCCS